MTAGAVQILLKSSGLLPSEGLVLAGSGPLLYLLAWQLVQAGRMPAALLDTATSDNFSRALRHLPGVLRPTALGYLRKGIALKLALRSAGLVIHKGVTDIRIEGGERCEAVRFRCGEASIRVAATMVALHEGVIPAQQATRSIGCAHVWDDVQRCFRPQLDAWGNTSVAGILVAGDAGGIGGARAAEHAGRIAGWEALRHLGRIDAARRDQTAAADHAGLAAHLAVRPMLDQMFAPREEILRPANEVVVCRCEEITAGDIRGVVARGCQGPNQAKAFLRAGMGPCQGRMCGPAVSELIAAELDQPVADVGYYRIRPPLKPVTVGELAALEIDA
jgi:bacterioferritin-associated ferredoxin